MPDRQAYMLGFNSLTVQAAIIVHTTILVPIIIIFIVISSEESMTLLSVRRDEPSLAV